MPNNRKIDARIISLTLFALLAFQWEATTLAQTSNCSEDPFSETELAYDSTPRFYKNKKDCVKPYRRPIVIPDRKYLPKQLSKIANEDLLYFARLYTGTPYEQKHSYAVAATPVANIKSVFIQRQRIPSNLPPKVFDTFKKTALTYGSSAINTFLKSHLNVKKVGKKLKSVELSYYHAQLKVEFYEPLLICDQKDLAACKRGEFEVGPKTLAMVYWPATLSSEKSMDNSKGFAGEYSAVGAIWPYDTWEQTYFKGPDSRASGDLVQAKLKNESQAKKIAKQFVCDSHLFQDEQAYLVRGNNCATRLSRTVSRALNTSFFAVANIACDERLPSTPDGYKIIKHFRSLGVKLDKEETIKSEPKRVTRKKKGQSED